MGDKKRSYLNPEFDLDMPDSIAQLKEAAAWNWDLAKRKVKKIFNQRAADQEYAANNPKPKRSMLGGNTKSLLDQIDE